jgi:DNA polymerase I-like protein with 3'-5' exonuclease and polymerase domains
VETWQIDQKMQRVCADMHDVGMFVDQPKRLQDEKKMLARRYELLQWIRQALSLPSFNPGSTHQLRDVLFERWRLEVPLEDKDRYTNSGDPSTGDLVLRALLCDPAPSDMQRQIIKWIRYYRKVQKVLGTYVVKMRPDNLVIESDLQWDEDEDWADKEARDKYGLEKRGIVDVRTGRMHPGYNAQVAVTGRLSSSKPINAQKYPKAMRALVCAQPGHVLVGADMDQLELRIAAALWDVQLYLRAFATGKDPHSMTAFAVFGQAFLDAAGLTADQFDRPGLLVGASYINGKFEGSGDAKKMRDLSKAVQYASQYKAAVETVQKLIQKTEVPARNEDGTVATDGTTDMPYAQLPLKRVRKMRDNWLKGAPEFESGWERELATFARQGFLKEPITGRRRDFLDGLNPNEIVNFRIQASAAGLMNLALTQLHERIPAYKWGPGTGIINQCHDSIVVECPESEGQKVAAWLEECMNQTHPALPCVEITATAAIGKTWKEVG